MRDYEKLFKALANRRRLQIIKYLKTEKEATVGEVAGYLKLSFKSTSKHLLILMHVGIVEKDQRGLSAFYSLAPHLPPLTKSVVGEL